MSGFYWLASYPKSGNTWFRLFLNSLLGTDEAPIGFDEIQTGAIASARTWLDDVLAFDTADLRPEEAQRLRPYVYDWSAKDSEISYHKIHDAYTVTDQGLPLVGQATPKGGICGVIYIMRNPLDIVASYANHLGVSLDRSIEYLGQADHRIAAPNPGRIKSQLSQTLLSWSGHVTSWIDTPDLTCHVMRYEDMVQTPLRTFTAAAKYLDIMSHPDAIARAIEHTQFDRLKNMEAKDGFRERPAKSKMFFRKGQVGGWREELSTDQANQVIKDHAAVMTRFGYLDAEGQPV